MRGKTALIGFLVLQAAMLIFWIGSLGPVVGSGPMVSDAQQIWSGGVFSTTTGSFRGDQGVSAAKFELAGPMLWGAALIVLAGIAGWLGGGEFHRTVPGSPPVSPLWRSAWQRAAPCFVPGNGPATLRLRRRPSNVSVLYMATRTALIQLALGWVLLAIYTVLSIAGFSTAGKPLGYHLVVVNWAIVAIVWAALYLGLYASPGLFGRA